MGPDRLYDASSAEGLDARESLSSSWCTSVLGLPHLLLRASGTRMSELLTDEALPRAPPTPARVRCLMEQEPVTCTRLACDQAVAEAADVSVTAAVASSLLAKARGSAASALTGPR